MEAAEEVKDGLFSFLVGSLTGSEWLLLIIDYWEETLVQGLWQKVGPLKFKG